MCVGFATITAEGGSLVSSHSGIAPHSWLASYQHLLRSETRSTQRKRRNPKEPDLCDSAGGDAVSWDHRIRGLGGAAGGERPALAAQLHPAGTARAGENAPDPAAHESAGRMDAVPRGLRDSRQSVRADLPAMPRPGGGPARRCAHRVAAPRAALRGEA